MGLEMQPEVWSPPDKFETCSNMGGSLFSDSSCSPFHQA